MAASGLTVRFGGLTALNEVQLTVRPAEIHALIGPNGAGKSTFVNTVTGFYQPDSGHFKIDGVSLNGYAPHLIARKGFARTFQNIRLFKDLSVLDNIRLGKHTRIKSIAKALIRDEKIIMVYQLNLRLSAFICG